MHFHCWPENFEHITTYIYPQNDFRSAAVSSPVPQPETAASHCSHPPVSTFSPPKPPYANPACGVAWARGACTWRIPVRTSHGGLAGLGEVPGIQGPVHSLINQDSQHGCVARVIWLIACCQAAVVTVPDTAEGSVEGRPGVLEASV